MNSKLSKVSLKSSTRSPKRSQRALATQRDKSSKLTLNISQTKVEEYSDDAYSAEEIAADKIRQLQDEKSSVERQLIREKQEKMTLLTKIKNMERQSKRSLKKDDSGQKSLETIQSDLKDKHEREIKSLNKKVKNLEKKTQNNSEVEVLRKELDD